MDSGVSLSNTESLKRFFGGGHIKEFLPLMG